VASNHVGRRSVWAHQPDEGIGRIFADCPLKRLSGFGFIAEPTDPPPAAVAPRHSIFQPVFSIRIAIR
jgi:hypothetical protein